MPAALPVRPVTTRATARGHRAATTTAATSRASASRSSSCSLLGFNTIYLNPIFWSKSNHGYDTADYKTINPYFGTLKEFDLLVQQAHELHMHIILDGVFNHMSSDSPFFDRYHHSATVGACESTSSAYRSWFVFTNTHVPCTSGDYSGWFNFDSIPVLAKSNPAVFDYFVGAQDSVTRTWLKRGCRRLAARRDGRQLVPGRLLDALPRRS